MLPTVSWDAAVMDFCLHFHALHLSLAMSACVHIGFWFHPRFVFGSITSLQFSWRALVVSPGLFRVVLSPITSGSGYRVRIGRVAFPACFSGVACALRDAAVVAFCIVVVLRFVFMRVPYIFALDLLLAGFPGFRPAVLHSARLPFLPSPFTDYNGLCGVRTGTTLPLIICTHNAKGRYSGFPLASSGFPRLFLWFWPSASRHM
jgi:hypothetical protein